MNVIIIPSENIIRSWVAHCLEIDVVTQRTSPEHAIEMMIEAVKMIIDDDLTEGRNPLCCHHPAPGEDWEKFFYILQNSKPIQLEELPKERIGELVLT
jgi:predicted RNase H-like HicB family nuclease